MVIFLFTFFKGKSKLTFDPVQSRIGLNSPFDTQGSPDLRAAREVADYLGTRHQELYFTVQVVSYKILLLDKRNTSVC